MKMIKKILSFIILFTLLYKSSFVVYATSSGLHPDQSKPIGNQIVEGTKWVVPYIISEISAVVGGDFEGFLRNQAAWDDYWSFENIKVNEETGKITFSEDLVSYIKQALQDYSNETNGYFLIPTMSLAAMSPSDFRTRSTYQTVYNLVNEKGILGVYVNNSYSYAEQKAIDVCYFADLSDFTKDGYNFVLDQKYTNIDNIINNTPCNIVCIAYDSDWQFTGFGHYVYNNYLESTYAVSSFDDMDYIYYENDTTYYGSYVHNTSHFKIQNINRNSNVVSASYYNTQGGTSINVVTPHGDRVRVFKDLNALKYYSVDKRTVYFGSDFYNKEPTEITLKIDDLDKYMNMDFDKYFGELQDTIKSQGSNLSEADVEKLTDSLLGKLNDINNNIGNVGESVQETNNLLSQILGKLDNLDKNVSSILENLDNKVSSTLDINLSGIEERLDSILSSLDNMSGLLNDKTEEEIIGRYNNFLDNTFNDFDEVGELLETKFPTSIPWDIANMLEMLRTGQTGYEDDSGGGDNENSGSSSLGGNGNTSGSGSQNTGNNNIHHSMPSGLDNVIQNNKGALVHTSSLYGEDGTQLTYGYGAYITSSGAPVFCIPALFSHSMKIGGLLIIDLTGFEIIHDIGRVLFTLIFCMNLIHLTVKAVALGKDVLT